MRCLEVNNVKRISAVGIINDPWIILGTSRFGRPNTFGKRKNFYVKELKLGTCEYVIQYLQITFVLTKNFLDNLVSSNVI